jgi:hypothetical protein
MGVPAFDWQKVNEAEEQNPWKKSGPIVEDDLMLSRSCPRDIGKPSRTDESVIDADASSISGPWR